MLWLGGRRVVSPSTVAELEHAVDDRMFDDVENWYRYPRSHVLLPSYVSDRAEDQWILFLLENLRDEAPTR